MCGQSGREQGPRASLESAIPSRDAGPPYARRTEMATQATPGNEVPDIRAGGAMSPRAHQAGIQGREAELRLIGARLDEVAGGSGGVIVVEGASGIGKTRLPLEAVRYTKRRGGSLTASRCRPRECMVAL